MNRSDHERARELILMSDVEGISREDAAWVNLHLSECPECSSVAEALQMTSSALRGVPITASSALVSTTQARIRARAAELRDREAQIFLIGISFCLGLLWSAVSAFAGWKFSGWLAQKFHIEAWVMGAGLVVFWLLPALAMALVLLIYHRPPLRADLALWMGARGEGEFQ